MYEGNTKMRMYLFVLIEREEKKGEDKDKEGGINEEEPLLEVWLGLKV